MHVILEPPFDFHYPSTIGYVVSRNWIQALAELDRRNRYTVYNYCVRNRASRKRQLFCPEQENFSRFVPPLPMSAVRWADGLLGLDVQGWLLRRQGGSVLHALDSTYLMPRRFPFLVTFYDVLPEVFPDWFPPSFAPVRSRMRENASRAVHIVANPSSTKRDLVKHYGIPEDKVTVIDLGVDAGIFHRVADPSELEAVSRKFGLPGTFIMAMGPFGPKKNHERLVEAYASLAGRFPDLGLVLVGEQSPYQETLEKLALQLRAPRVVFPGAVSDRDLVCLYSMASVLSHALVYEGFGLPLLEAMACGCPVVTSTSASLPEVVGDAGLVVDYRDAWGLAEALGSVLEQPKLAERLRAAGRERARRYTWMETARKTLELYERLLG